MTQPPQEPYPGGWTPPPPPQGIQWAAPEPAPPGGAWDATQGVVPAPKPKARGKLIAGAVAAVALVGGGVATYAAVSDTSKHGATSPREAIQTIVDDLNKSDLVGVLDDLAPGERTALLNPALDSIKQLKRLKVIQQNANPNAVSGFGFQARNLQFAPQTVVVNDHVQVVELTGGTVTVNSDLSKLPFTSEFLKVVFPDGTPSSHADTQDIAKAVADRGSPFRFAVQKVGGRWYPSIAYTIADNAAHDAGVTPTAADYIPAAGAGSAEAAVRQVIEALVKGDVAGAIKLTSPDEMAALHDYGGIVAQNASYGAAPATIKDLQLTSRPISGGAQHVSLKQITVVDGSNEVTVAVEGSCFRATRNGDSRKLCADDVISLITQFLTSGMGATDNVTDAQRTALSHLIAGLTDVGVDASQSGGVWYVNPGRSYLDIVNSVLGGLQGDDAVHLVQFFSALGG